MKANDIKSSSDFTKESTAYKRILSLTGGEFTEIGEFVTDGDRAAQVVTGTAEVCGVPCMVFSQNPDVENGAMSKAHCEKISKIYELAEKTGVPVVGFYDSYGAKVTDGVTALDSYSGLLKLSNRLSGVVPQIAVVAGTCASSAAMLAMSADIIIMTEDAQLFLTSPFNSSKTDGSAKTAAKNGCVHIVVKNMEEACKKVSDILTIFPVNNISEPVYTPPVSPKQNSECTVCGCVDEGSKIPVMKDFGTGIHTAFARIDGTPVGIVNTDSENGKISSDSALKAANFVRLCDAFSIPVVTFVDSEGFEDEGGKELRAAARMAASYSEATTVKISVIRGRAHSQAFVALCGKNSCSDAVIALENSAVSPIAPDAAVMLLFEDRLKNGESREALKEEYLNGEASAYTAAASGAVDKIVSEENLRDTLVSLINTLCGKRETTLSKKHSNMPL